MLRLSTVLTWVQVALLPAVLALPSPLAATSGPRIFNIELTWHDYAPDGFTRKMILMNGQYPGPLMEMNEGDQVHVFVVNKTPFNTTMHFHGIEQTGTPWSDGVPGVTQRFIGPGASFEYQFTADMYGSYWYHAHEKGQLDDGMYGPMVIYPAPTLNTPFNLITTDQVSLNAINQAVKHVMPLVLSDFRHRTSDDAWSITVASGIELPCYDSLLINGKGRVNCQTADQIASLLTPLQKQLLQQGNATAFTAKGCMPPQVLANVLARGAATDVAAIPSDIFDVCNPTNSPNEVLTVHKKACDPEKWIALDLIGTYGLLTTSFSIDELPMWVYAVDGEYIEPQLVQAIEITNGDRYSVLVKLTTAGDYTIRHSSTSATQIMSGIATLSYRAEGQTPFTRATTPYIANNGLNTTANVVFFNELKQKSFPPFPIAAKSDQTYKLHLRVAGQSYNWALNGTMYPMSLDAANPVLFNPQPDRNNNVTMTTLNDTWVDLILVTATWPMPPHPIHKHGNKMFLLGKGNGYFNWTTVDEAAAAMPNAFNFVDPPRRDGFATLQAVQGPTWMVLRYHVSNPGAWLLHCHIQSHLIGGMNMVIQDGIDHWPTVPAQYLNYA